MRPGVQSIFTQIKIRRAKKYVTSQKLTVRALVFAKAEIVKKGKYHIIIIYYSNLVVYNRRDRGK